MNWFKSIIVKILKLKICECKNCECQVKNLEQ